MADVEKVEQGCKCCDHPLGERKCKKCPYAHFLTPYCNIHLAHDALSVIEEQRTENKALRLLLDWAVECDFGYDQFFEEYEKYKHETEGLGYTEGMIKVARCVLAEKES